MLCQNCNAKEANVHITKIVNGVKNEMHLCEDCAKQKNEFNITPHFNFGFPLSFQNIFEGLVEMSNNVPKYITEEEECPVCHMKFNEFKRTGRLGCSRCYEAFNDNMVPLIKRIHGNIHHNGKVPARTGGKLKVERDIERLREELKTAVAREEYEKAAKLRDQIKELESKAREDK